MSFLRELGQRNDINKSETAKFNVSSAPSSPGVAGVVASDASRFPGNLHRATYTYLRACRTIFDGTFQPVFITSSLNPLLRDAWTAALEMSAQAARSQAVALSFISHESVSDPIVTCASFYGILLDYIEPRVADGRSRGLYGRSLASTINERYNGEMRGGRVSSHGGGSDAVTSGDLATRDAAYSVHLPGLRTSNSRLDRKSNVLRIDDAGSIAGTDDTARGTALSLADSMEILRPATTAHSRRAAAERAFVIYSKYVETKVSTDPAFPTQSMRICRYVLGPAKCVVWLRRLQEPVRASLTHVNHVANGEGGPVAGYAAVPAVRAAPGVMRLSGCVAFRAALIEMLTAAPVHRTAEDMMLPAALSGGRGVVSIDALPVKYTEAQ